METVGRGPDSAIASGSASATGVSLAVAPPSRMTWRTNSNVSTGVRKNKAKKKEMPRQHAQTKQDNTMQTKTKQNSTTYNKNVTTQYRREMEGEMGDDASTQNKLRMR